MDPCPVKLNYGMLLTIQKWLIQQNKNSLNVPWYMLAGNSMKQDYSHLLQAGERPRVSEDG